MPRPKPYFEPSRPTYVPSKPLERPRDLERDSHLFDEWNTGIRSRPPTEKPGDTTPDAPATSTERERLATDLDRVWTEFHPTTALDPEVKEKVMQDSAFLQAYCHSMRVHLRLKSQFSSSADDTTALGSISFMALRNDLGAKDESFSLRASQLPILDYDFREQKAELFKCIMAKGIKERLETRIFFAYPPIDFKAYAAAIIDLPYRKYLAWYVDVFAFGDEAKLQGHVEDFNRVRLDLRSDASSQQIWDELEIRTGPPKLLVFDPKQPEMIQQLRGYDGNVLVPNPADLRAARAAVRDADASKALVLLQRSENAAQALTELRNHPVHLTVLYDFPTTLAMAKAIHGRAVSSNELADVIRARSSLEASLVTDNQREKVKSIDLTLVRAPETVRDIVFRKLEELHLNEQAVIVGHVEDGDIRFHDGSRIAIKSIPKRAKVWLLGCRTVQYKDNNPDGLDLATGRKIRYADAAAAVESIVRDFQRRGSYREMLLNLQNLPPSRDSLPRADQTSKVMHPRANGKRPQPAVVRSGFAFGVVDANVISIQPLSELAA